MRLGRRTGGWKNSCARIEGVESRARTMLRDGSARTSHAQGSIHQSTGNRCLGADPKFNTPDINAVKCRDKSTHPLAWRSGPPDGDLVTPVRSGYESIYPSPLHRVGMRGNPLFPKLHAEP